MTDARPTDPTNLLSAADALAEQGQWLAAIDAWQVAAAEQPSLQPSVERRLDWFLAETGQPAGNSRRVLTPVLLFLSMTALGMAFLLFAGDPGSTGANLWAVATWVAVVVACIAALVAARRTGDVSLGTRIAGARRVAVSLEPEHATGENA